MKYRCYSPCELSAFYWLVFAIQNVNLTDDIDFLTTIIPEIFTTSSCDWCSGKKDHIPWMICKESTRQVLSFLINLILWNCTTYTGLCINFHEDRFTSNIEPLQHKNCLFVFFLFYGQNYSWGNWQGSIVTTAIFDGLGATLVIQGIFLAVHVASLPALNIF